jgi:hypothetical protein
MRKRKTAAAAKMAGTAARPTRTKTFTGRDFVKLLRSLPRPDQEYLDAVERHVRKQPKAEKSKWRKSKASRP